MTPSKLPPGEGPPTPEVKKTEYIHPGDIISTDSLDYLAEGVRVRYVPLTRGEVLQAKMSGRSGWYTKDVGDVGVRIKEIHYNPETFAERGEGAVRAVALHEALHHARPVVAFDLKTEQIGRRTPVPEVFQVTEQMTERFKMVLRAYLGNAVIDRFLEFYAIREPFRDRFLPDYQQKMMSAEGRDLRSLPLPMQFMQAMLGAERFFGGENKDTVDERVLEAMRNIAVALEAIDDVSTYEDYLHEDDDEKEDVKRKAYAFEHLILPEFVKLLEEEVEKMKEEHEEKEENEPGSMGEGQEGGGEGEGEPQEGEEGEDEGQGGGKPGEGEEGEGTSGAGGEGENKGEQKPGKGKPSKGKPGKGKPGEGGEPGEMPQELIDEISELLQKMINQGKQQFAAPSAQDPLQELINQAAGLSNKPKKEEGQKGKEKGKGEGEGEEEGEGEGEGESEVEKRKREAKEAEQRAKQAKARGTAERLGVDEQAVENYDRYKEQFRREIAVLRDAIINVMREERRSVLSVIERMGEVTPGLEVAAVTARIAGDLEPRVHIGEKEAKVFSKVRLFFVVDVSGSMGGAPIEAARAAVVIINEAFAEAKNKMQQEHLLAHAGEEPLEFGLMAFEGANTIAHPIGAPLDETAKYKMMEAMRPGGGTNDYDALVDAEKELEERARSKGEDYIDIMVVFSDGYGDTAKVSGFADRIRATEKFSLGAFDVGANAGDSQVREVYGGRPDGVDAVYGNAHTNPNEALPDITKFLAGRIEREIKKRNVPGR